MKLFLLILTLHYQGGIITTPWELTVAKSNDPTEFMAYGFLPSQDKVVETIRRADDMVYGYGKWNADVYEVTMIAGRVDLRKMPMSRAANDSDTLRVDGYR